MFSRRREQGWVVPEDDEDAKLACAQLEGLGRLYADTVLGMGGSRPAADVFRMFRGRPPSATALLRHNDLLPQETQIQAKL